MTRKQYLAAVIEAYLGAPDTPSRSTRADWAIASALWKSDIALETLQVAIHLASLRRSDRAPDLEPLEPIRSLAYFKPVIQQLNEQSIDRDYARYLSLRFQQLMHKTAAKTRDSRGF